MAVYQEIDALRTMNINPTYYLVLPRMIAISIALPVLVIFSLLVGEHFFQIKGALFAVPCMSIAQTFFLHFREVTMGLADPMASIPPAA